MTRAHERRLNRLETHLTGGSHLYVVCVPDEAPDQDALIAEQLAEAGRSAPTDDDLVVVIRRLAEAD